MKMTMKKEIMPLGVNLMIQPYLENPYLQLKTESGLELSTGEFMNPDSGELEKLKSDICCGLVIEVGSQCKEVKVGDEVFYNINVTRPIPFMGKGFLLAHEPGLIAILGENLQERFNK